MTARKARQAASGHDGKAARPAGGDRRIALLQAQLEAAHRITNALFESPRPEDVIARTLQVAIDMVGAEGGSLLLADQETRALVFHHSLGVKQVPAGTSIPWDSGVAGAVFLSGVPTIVHDAARDGRHFKGIDTATEYVTRDILAVPLRRWDGTTTGVMEILNKREGGFAAEDLVLLGVVADISATAIERARLHEAEKLADIARLFGDISHDIKNLLMPVIAGAEIIAEALPVLYDGGDADTSKAGRSYARCRWAVNALEVSARRTQERLKEISDCIHGVGVQPRFAPCRLAPLVDEVFGALASLVAQRGLTLATQGLEDLPEILADDGLIFNALYNLVNNAIPEVPEGGSVTVNGERDNGRGGIVISVVDTGRGMPPEVVERLFTDHGKSRKHLGSGLGTRIVKNAVEAHGGTIEVRSTVGAGTTFRFFLPAAPAQRA